MQWPVANARNKKFIKFIKLESKMKRVGTIIIAIALVLGLSQCKKRIETISDVASNGVFITLNVDNGSKYEVITGTGEVNYTVGDKVFVGNNGAYCGTLTYDGTVFSGTIDPTKNDYLYFYFVSGLLKEEDMSAATQTYTVDISDQSSQLPVLSCGRSNVKFKSDINTYSSTLLNKCALVKFTLSSGTSSAVKVCSMKSEAKIDFATHTIKASGKTNSVMLYSSNELEKWAVLLPQDAVYGAISVIDGNNYNCNVGAITENGYITDNVIDNTSVMTDKVFTVSSDGNMVVFSKGNLQYTKSTGEWSFMEPQYQIVEINDQDVGGNYANQDVVSLFGWGTSGWDNTSNDPLATNFQPYSTSNVLYDEDSQTNMFHYGPSWVNGEYTEMAWTNYDWGIYNSCNITNGDNYSWRTLTVDEWEYIFNTRSASRIGSVDNARFARANLLGTTHGVILFPDNYNHPSSVNVPIGINETYYNVINSSWDGNQYTITEWTEMENAGAIFLPATGTRDGGEVYGVGEYGRYWTSTSNESPGAAANAYFSQYNVSPRSSSVHYYGHAVRLVR